MNSFKSTITVLFLLGVSYGVYRLIHTPDPTASGSGPFFVAAAPATPNVNIDASAKVPSTNLDSTPRSSLSPPAPKSFDPPTNPKIEAPDLARPSPSLPPANSAPTSMYQRGTNSLAESPTSPPSSAKLIPTEPESAKLMTVGGTTSSPNVADKSAATGPDAMTGPLTPVVDPNSSLGKAYSNEIALSGSPSKPNTTPLVSTLPNVVKSNPPQLEAARPVQDLKSVWPIVDAQVRKGEIAQSLQLLSGYYNANLSEADRAELLKWLDALAGKVIYSTEDRLAATPHVVQAGETLESIAKDWSIPKDLLVNINRSKIPANNTLTRGLELKVVRGPFRAEIDSQRNELTLFLDRLYAGRFAIDTSNCEKLKTGQLAVQNLRMDSPGQYCLELAGGLCLVAGTPPAGSSSIQMNVADAKDVFGILSANSQVTVIR